MSPARRSPLIDAAKTAAITSLAKAMSGVHMDVVDRRTNDLVAPRTCTALRQRLAPEKQCKFDRRPPA
jgi:hypothetical protein